MIRIVDMAFDPEAELAAFRQGLRDSGALVAMTGIVRPESDALHLEHYPGVTERVIAGFVAELCGEFGLESALVIHRVGRIAQGQPIMLAATASAHRKASIRALDRLMDWLKSEAPFWKLEEAGDVRRWIEPSGS